MELEITASASALAALDCERELVERAKRNREAFAALYRKHYRAIAGYIYRRVGHQQTTEDLAADVFLVALRTLPRFRQRGVPVLAWLYRIASNRVNRWARRERKRAARQLTIEPTGGGEAPGQAASDREYARAALLTLPPRHQTVLALHYLEGMPIKDIALTIGCREGTVKSRLARGRQALRQSLQKGRSQP